MLQQAVGHMSERPVREDWFLSNFLSTYKTDKMNAYCYVSKIDTALVCTGRQYSSGSANESIWEKDSWIVKYLSRDRLSVIKQQMDVCGKVDSTERQQRDGSENLDFY